uniref:cysteine--tRNA ligase n=1 Tax=Phallusia mammillata TaxID=59560 RepID=A0A6F9D7R6_9ASCI|nr:cysteine--tRNA ligase, mitochondrial-like [Phallusia mammillata]
MQLTMIYRSCLQTLRFHSKCYLSFMHTPIKRQYSEFVPLEETEGIKTWLKPEGYNTGIRVANGYEYFGKHPSKTLCPLIVKDPQNITWYSCGPTVYDDTHIGHACTYVRLDAIRRVLTNFFGFDVKMVMGITDVDDKLIIRSQLLNKEMQAMAQHYEILFQRDMCLLNVLPPHQYVRVSEIIPHIISFIDKLIKDGHAYATPKGDVWFNTNKFTDVGRLSRMYEEFEMQENPWVAKSQQTRSKRDFALWKAAKPSEPYWDAPWGKGRPGWHVECSTIGTLAFGSQIDIHSGGRDLCFPHHECELLQSEAYHGCDQWVNYFLHTGPLVLKGDTSKMSKSFGNTILVSDFLQKHSSDLFRYLALSTSYQMDLTYTEFDIYRIGKQIRRSCNILSKCHNYINKGGNYNINTALITEKTNLMETGFIRLLQKNFRIPVILSILRHVEYLLEESLTDVEDTDVQYPSEVGCIQRATSFIEDVYQKLGFVHMNGRTRQVDGQTHQIIKVNLDFRRNVRNFAKEMLKSGNQEQKTKAMELLSESDKMRSSLNKLGVTVKDDYHETIWTYTEKDFRAY